MRRRTVCLLASTLVLSLGLAAPLVAQPKKDRRSGLDRIEGTIQRLDKENQSMSVRQRSRHNMVWTILYTEETAITYRNEDASAEDLEVGRRVIALGRFAEEGIKLKALRIDIRSGR